MLCLMSTLLRSQCGRWCGTWGDWVRESRASSHRSWHTQCTLISSEASVVGGIRTKRASQEMNEIKVMMAGTHLFFTQVCFGNLVCTRFARSQLWRHLARQDRQTSIALTYFFHC